MKKTLSLLLLLLLLATSAAAQDRTQIFEKVHITSTAGDALVVDGGTNIVAAEAVKLHTARAINNVPFDGTQDITIAAAVDTLTFGSHLTGAHFDGTAPVTIGVDCTSSSTVSVLVCRDGSGNFSAGTITAALTGNASSATKLQTARTINGVAFDGTQNITVSSPASALTFGTHLTGTSYDGSAPVTIGVDATSASTAGAMVARDVSGNFAAATITASLTGTATHATTLATPRNINGVAFDGSGDITIAAAASSLTGSTLASGVTASSLTSVGTLTGGATGSGFTLNIGASTLSGTVGAANGGTGQSSYTVGDLLYASASSTLSTLAASSTVGAVLASGGATTAPRYVTSVLVNSGPTNNTLFVQDLTATTGVTKVIIHGGANQQPSGAKPFQVLDEVGGTLFSVTPFGNVQAGGSISIGGSLGNNGTFGMTTTGVDAVPTVTWFWRVSAFGSPDTGFARGGAGIFKVTNGSTGYGTVDTAGLKVSGTAGVSCTVATPASLTVVNGVVTGCS